MSLPPKRSSREVFAAMMDAPVRDEADRIEGLSKDELEAELRAAGFTPEDVVALGDRARREGARARELEKARREVVRGSEARARPATRWALILAAALGAGVVAVVGVPPIVAYFRGPSSTEPPTDGRDLRYAGEQRKDAFKACAESRWQDCASKLDDAKRLDPAGEADPGVVEARRAVRRAQAPVPTVLPGPPTTPEGEKKAPNDARGSP
jgi:hypothetical protein